jgi:hypothetical protein
MQSRFILAQEVRKSAANKTLKKINLLDISLKRLDDETIISKTVKP